MKEEIELCAELCPADCIYRSTIESGLTPICYYSVLERQARKCKISECDKYKPGEPLKPYMTVDYYILWDYVCEDADSIR